MKALCAAALAAVALSGCTEESTNDGGDAEAVTAEIERMKRAEIPQSRPSYAPPYEAADWGKSTSRANVSDKAAELIEDHRDDVRERDQEARIQAIEFDLSH